MNTLELIWGGVIYVFALYGIIKFFTTDKRYQAKMVEKAMRDLLRDNDDLRRHRDELLKSKKHVSVKKIQTAERVLGQR